MMTERQAYALAHPTNAPTLGELVAKGRSLFAPYTHLRRHANGLLLQSMLMVDR